MNAQQSTRNSLTLLIALYFPLLVLVCGLMAVVAALLFMTAANVGRYSTGLAVVVALPAVFLGLTVFHALAALATSALATPGDKDKDELQLPREWLTGLFQLTADVARQRDLPMPDDIRLHPGTVAHIYEDRAQRAILVIGGLSLVIFSQEALAGIIAHELGHYAAGDLQFARRSMRWHLLIQRLEMAFARQPGTSLNPLIWLVRGYHVLLQRAWAADRRQSEFAADRHEVALIGKKASARTSILLSAIDCLPWSRLSSIAESFVVQNERLDQIFAEQARRARATTPEEWQDACRKALSQKTEALDSHPCLRERLKAIGVTRRKALDLALDLNLAGPPGRELVPQWEAIEKKLTDQIVSVYREVYWAKRELAQIFSGRPL